MNSTEAKLVKNCGRQGDVIFVRFEPIEGTALFEWCQKSMETLNNIIENNPMDKLYSMLHEYRKKQDPLDYAYGETSGHVHTTLPGDAAIGLKVDGVLGKGEGSKGINASYMPSEVLKQMNPTRPINIDTIKEFVVVAGAKPFTVYHVNAGKLSTTMFDVESLKESDIADHALLHLDKGFWLSYIQASVNIKNELIRVAD